MNMNEKLAEMEKAIFSQAGEEFNIQSEKQLGVILFEKLKVKTATETDTDNATSTENLTRIANEHPIIPLIIEYRETIKELNRKKKNTQGDTMQKLIGLIPTGKKSALSVPELSMLMGMTERQLKQLVLQARLDDVIICSGQNGYYYPQNDDELLEWYKVARSRGITSLRTLKASRKRLKDAGIDPEKNDEDRDA